MLPCIIHRYIKNKRQENAYRYIPKEQFGVFNSFEVKSDVLCGAAEEGHGNGIRETYAKGAHVGGEQFGFYHCIDRGIATNNDERRHNEREGYPGVFSVA